MVRAFDPFPFAQDFSSPSEVAVSGREVAQTLVVAAMAVVLER